MTTKQLTIADVTRPPKTRPATLDDGTPTGMFVTLGESVCLTNAGPMLVRSGEIITGSISGGFHGGLMSMSTTRKIGTNGQNIIYRY